MYATQCVPFEGYKLTVPISGSKGSSLKQMPISFKNKDEGT